MEKLTLADYRELQALINRQMDFFIKLPDSENRRNRLSSLLALAQKIDLICHDLMKSEIKVNA